MTEIGIMILIVCVMVQLYMILNVLMNIEGKL